MEKIRTFSYYYFLLKIPCYGYSNYILVISSGSLSIWLSRDREGEVIYTREWLWTSTCIESSACGRIDFCIEWSWLSKSWSCWISRSSYSHISIAISKSICRERIDYNCSTGSIDESTIGRACCHGCTIDCIGSDFYAEGSRRSGGTREISESECTRTRYSHIQCWEDTSRDNDTIDRTTRTRSDECVVPVDRSGESTRSNNRTSTDLRSRDYTWEDAASWESEDRSSYESRTKNERVHKNNEK
jgi:hypothetical protein